MFSEENFEEIFSKVLADLGLYREKQKTPEQVARVFHRVRDMLGNKLFYLHRIRNGEHVHICRHCGALEAATFNEVIKTRLIENQSCFHCDHWEQTAKEQNPRRLIIGGELYGDAGDQPKAKRKDFLGHAGQQFTIEKDGKIWTTNNLWSGGTIPEEFRDRLPDNAKFVKSTIKDHSGNCPGMTH